jgi:drug/metabolite transporter (DMT)-like permease
MARAVGRVRQMLTPALFVFLWASGFVGAKYGLPYAEPVTFLVWRLGAVILLLAALVLATRAPWPNRRNLLHAAVAGLLLQAGYLGGVFTALAHGLPASLASLVVGLQPLLTAVLAPWLLRERITPRQWIGLLLGLCGVVLVLWARLSLDVDFGIGLLLSLVALVGITFGTIYQKRFCGGIDLRVGALVQYVASFVVLLAIAAGTETMQVRWTWPFVGALAYLVLVLSIGAVLLLLLLIRRGAASRVVGLFYLVPPTTALIAWAVLGEPLGPVALTGMALTAAGVALVSRG